MRRGDVHWVKFPQPVGRRPAVLVPREEAYSIRTRVTVVPLTLVAVSKDMLQERIATASAPRVRELDDALRFALDL